MTDTVGWFRYKRPRAIYEICKTYPLYSFKDNILFFFFTITKLVILKGVYSKCWSISFFVVILTNELLKQKWG